MEHFIKNIEITNFKSIRHAEVKDCRRVNVFVGYPNVGKSNILEALSLFDVVNSIKKIQDTIRVTSDPTIFFNGNIKNRISIKIDENYRIEGRYENENFIVSNYVQNKQVLLGGGREALEYNAMPYEYRRTVFKNFINENFENLLVRGAEVHTPIFKKYDFRKKTESKLGDFSLLSYPFGENLFSVIQSNSEIRKDLGSLLKPYNLKMLFNSSYQSFSLLKTIDEENVFSVDYSLIADTLQRLIFYKTAILSNKEQILLLEEPEAHMFPLYISKMTGNIIYDENNNQFFITTHSPYVLNDLIEDIEKEELAIYIVSYDAEQGETLIYRMSDEEVHEAHQFGYDFFMNIENFLPSNQHEQV